MEDGTNVAMMESDEEVGVSAGAIGAGVSGRVGRAGGRSESMRAQRRDVDAVDDAWQGKDVSTL